jgi:hypothetical protein
MQQRTAWARSLTVLMAAFSCWAFYGSLSAQTRNYALAPGYGLHYSPQEVAAWRTRSVSGPYRVTGDAGTNMPGDWTRILTYSDDFRASPADSGNTNAERLDIWTGYRYQYDSLDQYPIWQGIKMEAAAFRYLINSDTSYGQPVRRTLLAQINFTHPIHRGYNVAAWPVPSNTNARPSYEAGAKEALWLQRLLLSYDYTRNLYTGAERAQITAWFRASAYYYAGRIHNRMAQSLPDRLANNYTRRIYKAAPNGVPQWNPPVYAPVEYTRHQVWGGSGVYTHRNADGSLGNRISRLGYDYNNRVFEKLQFIAQTGIMCQDTVLISHARQTIKEFIRYATFPDGTYSEYERNGDYETPAQGALWYGSMNLQSIVTIADALGRCGDMDLYTFTTMDGVHGTQVPAGGTPKSLELILNRYAQNCLGQNPIYYNTVTANNRIDGNNENTASRFSTRHSTWDALLAVANKYYQSALYTSVYTRRGAGAVALPGANYTSAGKVWLPWCGAGAEYPGMWFVYGQMESVQVYPSMIVQPLACPVPVALAVSNIQATTAQLRWGSGIGNRPATGYQVRLRLTGGNWQTIVSADSAYTLQGLAANSAYQVQVAGLCSATDTSTFTSILSFLTLTAPCPTADNLRGSPITVSDSANISWNAAAGARTYQLRIKRTTSNNWKFIVTSATNIIETGLAAGVQYEMQLNTQCPTSQSGYAGVERFTMPVPPCPAVASVRTTPINQTAVTVSWPQAAQASQYELVLTSQSAGIRIVDTLSTLTRTFTSLPPRTNFVATVRALCPRSTATTTVQATFSTQTPTAIGNESLAALPEIRLSPNPASSTTGAYLTGPASKATLYLADASGRAISATSIQLSENQGIDLLPLLPEVAGMYLVTIRQDLLAPKTLRLIRQ